MTGQLSPGAAIFSAPGGGPALRSPEGDFFTIALPAESVAQIHTLLTEENFAIFSQAGYATTQPIKTLSQHTIGVIADTPIAQIISETLANYGAKVLLLQQKTALVAQEVTAVCALSDGPAPAWWAELDVLLARGIAWQRISREGRHVLFEPLAAQPGDVGHNDIRLRRLATAGSGYRHLQAYWAQTLAGTTLSSADSWQIAELRLVVAMAVLDLHAWALGWRTPQAGSLNTSLLPTNRRLRVLDLDTGAISDHPVLPVPVAAP